MPTLRRSPHAGGRDGGGDDRARRASKGAPFWSESSFFVNRLGMPAVYCAPGDIRNCHTHEEHVEIEEYFAGVVGFADLHGALSAASKD